MGMLKVSNFTIPHPAIILIYIKGMPRIFQRRASLESRSRMQGSGGTPDTNENENSFCRLSNVLIYIMKLRGQLFAATEFN